jgi:hypothetical protein
MEQVDNSQLTALSSDIEDQRTSVGIDSGLSEDRLQQESSPLSADVLPNRNWLKPFEHGWRRHLVYRSNIATDAHGKAPSSDVYYFAPNGTKL